MTTAAPPRAATHASAACAAIASIVIAGCAASVPPLPEGAPVATWEWNAEGADQALLEGELALEDGCVYVVSSDGLRTLPVFPVDRVGWDADAETLTYGGAEFEMGDAIAAGGGWTAPPESAIIPDGCEPDEWGDVMLVQDESLAPMTERGY
ncbi:hypothetical protein ACNI3K_05560 [Demequina sp. SO4-13]|uniref:hypothetical protein n=1 Tax=Demequina sp. SO4-13 TaxID=3401027 RepID=UPI003AF66358